MGRSFFPSPFMGEGQGGGDNNNKERIVARYEHLPVYKLAMDLGICLQGVVKKFSRYNKDMFNQER